MTVLKNLISKLQGFVCKTMQALLGGFYDFRQRLQSLLLKYTDENSQVT